MLRLFVLLLALLNVAYFAWSQGMLRAYGWAPAEVSEPQRLRQQIRPQAVQILSTEEARRVEQTPPKPPECLLAGPFEEAQVEPLRKALEAGLPSGTWTLEPQVEPARWIIYMGKFPNEAALDRKRAELEKMKLEVDLVGKPELQLGLSLGVFETQAQAQAELTALQRRGVRTARVVQEQSEVRRQLLRVPAADDAIRPRLEELKPLLGEKAWRVCR